MRPLLGWLHCSAKLLAGRFSSSQADGDHTMHQSEVSQSHDRFAVAMLDGLGGQDSLGTMTTRLRASRRALAHVLMLNSSDGYPEQLFVQGRLA